MSIISANREEDLRKFLNNNGRIVSIQAGCAKFTQRVIAVSGDGKILQCVIDQKSRFIRELRCRYRQQIFPIQTPYIVELPNDYPVESETVEYTVSQPRKRKVIALPYEEGASTSSANIQKVVRKNKRIRNISHILNDKESYCCKTCFKHFSRKWNLDRHESVCIPRSINYRCPTCLKQYQKASYFTNHIRSHEAEKKKSNSKILELGSVDYQETNEKGESSIRRLAIPYEFGAFL